MHLGKSVMVSTTLSFFFLYNDLMNFCRVIIAHFYYLTHELMDGEEVGKELCRVDETKNPIP